MRAHLRAATTLVRNQAELDLAVRHAILAEDPEVLLHVLRVHGHGLFEGGGMELLAPALDALPREARSTDPAVLVLESLLCRMTLRYDEAADLSLAAERACEADPRHGTAEGDDLTLDMIALMRLWRSRCGWADPSPPWPRPGNGWVAGTTSAGDPPARPGTLPGVDHLADGLSSRRSRSASATSTRPGCTCAS